MRPDWLRPRHLDLLKLMARRLQLDRRFRRRFDSSDLVGARQPREDTRGVGEVTAVGAPRQSVRRRDRTAETRGLQSTLRQRGRPRQQAQEGAKGTRPFLFSTE